MCTVHDTKEYHPMPGIWVYPYRCSRCERCFICGHRQIDYTYWVCHDGHLKETTFDQGVLVP